MVPKIKTYNGLYYDLKKQFTAKYEALALAQKYRRQGYGARIEKKSSKMSGMTKYSVYKSRRKLR